MTLSAIQTLKLELLKLQQAQNECVTESGFIKNECKYKYQMLMEKILVFKESIDWLEAMKEVNHA